MKTHSVRTYLVLPIVLLSMLALGLPVAPARAADQVAVAPQVDPSVPAARAGLPTGASANWWAAVQEQIRLSECDITWQDSTYVPDLPAAYQAPNRAQGLRTYFTPQGLVVIPRPGAEEALPWQWGLRVSVSGSARLAATANRIEYQYLDLAGLTEAYINDEAGLHQELTLASALPGAGGQGVLDLAFSGGLVPGLAADGMAVEFSGTDGAPLLRYSLLAVTGSGGQPLAAHLELAGGLLRLAVDEGRPVYPLTITARLESTPLDTEETRRAPRAMTAAAPEGLSPTANWTAEGDQKSAYLGQSVGTAGDVNGDGYADLVVGAYNYDDGEYDEGAAFVWLGSATGLGPNGTPANADWMAESNQVSAYYGIPVGTAGDVNGDGYADVVVGAPYYDNGETDEGRVFVYYGNGGDGLDLLPRQMRTDGSAPIAYLGASDSPIAFQLRLTGRMPLGRDDVRLQWQVAPLGTPITATNVISGVSGWTDVLTTGVVITQNVTGLTLGTPYHWRTRLLYRPGNVLGQPAGRWIAIPWAGWNETDLRTEPPPAVQFSSATYSEDEGAGSATITVTLSTAFDLAVTVLYAASDGTATKPGDYTAVTGTLTFTPGLITRTFTVPIVDDGRYEADETILLTLSGPVSATLGAPYTATLTILDNDYAVYLPLVVRAHG